MRWLIKNPAPTDHRLMKWGDYHFGRALKKYLERAGEDVSVVYHSEWHADTEAVDVVLLLRGKYRDEYLDSAKFNIIWNMSHPGDVFEDEFQAYDLVLIASESHAARLQRSLGSKVTYFPQCTDPEEFYPVNIPHTYFLSFVGNTREVERSGIIWATQLGVPMAIYGRGWSKWVERSFVKGDYFPNEQLREMYCGSRAVMNDHWPDMLEFGYINNRIFDALACGVPVISDYHAELQQVFPQGVLFYRNAHELEEATKQLLLNYPAILHDVVQARQQVLAQYTFSVRINELLRLVRADWKRHVGKQDMAVTGPEGQEGEAHPCFVTHSSVPQKHCPVCATDFEEFLAGGRDGRPGVVCPNCGILDRHRLMWLFLQNETDLLHGGYRILHFAPERGLRRRLQRLPNTEYFGADVRPGRAQWTVDLSRITFADAFFDIVICSHVLEHVPDDTMALREIYRVLRPGGWAVIQVPVRGKITIEDPSITSPEGRKEKFGQEDHVRFYGFDIKQRIEKAGFRCEIQRPGETFVPEDQVRYGINPKQTLFVCTKDTRGE